MTIGRGMRTDGIRTVEDLMARCWVDPDTGCWHWRFARDSKALPSLRLAPLNRTVSLGVAACYFATGAAPKPGQMWHCTCTTPNCANPEHRRAGDRSSQMRAASLTRTPLQRARISAGKRAASHLTDGQRAEIAGSTEILRVLAERYGVSVSGAQKLRTARAPDPKAGFSVFSWRPV